MSGQTLMRIKELEERSGVPRTTIHFYLRQGLLHPPAKTGRTMAYYDESHLKRLQDIQGIKGNIRMPLPFLKERIAALGQEGHDGRIKRLQLKKDVATTTKAKDDKRQKIVEAAIQVFSQNGYHRTKVQDITNSVGISTGTFYIYFGNKRDLFVEVVDHVIRTILGEATNAITQEEDILKRMVVRGRAFYENYSRYNEILNQLRAEMAGEDEWPQQKIKKAYHDLTKPVIRDIQRGIDTGVYRSVDPDLLAYALTGIIEIMSLRMMIDGKYTFEDIMAFIVDFTTNGLARKA
ncbi:MAG: TetR family transcriptional regulator [Candidatus Marsarchaeota archaeon]|nr:TetR family transcriptional regulator [Candidatus Marsarchaeota archaeon]